MKNVGTTDAIVRVVMGLALVAIYLFGLLTGTAGIVMLVAGLVLMATAAAGFCPLYTLLGIKTCKR